MLKTSILSIFFASFFLCCAAQLPADTTKRTVKQPGFVEKMQEFAKTSAKTSADDLAMDRAAIVQMKVINGVRITLQEAKSFLSTSMDSLSVKKKIEEIQSDYQTASQGVFVDENTIQTYRNLTTTKKILYQLLIGAKSSKIILDRKQQALSRYRFELDSLLNTPELFIFPKDSISLISYVQNLRTLARETKPVDSMLKAADLNLQMQLNAYNVSINQMQISIDATEHFERNLGAAFLAQELPPIWNNDMPLGTFRQTLNFSIGKAILILEFYIQNNVAKLIFFPILILISFIYLRSLKRIYSSKNLLDETYKGQLVIRYPLFSAILLICSLYQFFFITPPFIFNVLIWIIAFVSLSVIIRGFITRYWFVFWLSMLLLFIIAAFGNLILQPSGIERYGMLMFSVLGILIGVTVLIHKRQTELKEKWIIYSIVALIIMELLSVSMNIAGRYNLAKTFMVVGYLNVVIAISFLWVVRLINEGLLLAFNIYTIQDRRLFYLNFAKVGGQAPGLLYFLLIFGWGVLMGRNFPLFDYLSRPLLSFLSAERSLGDYSFSINGIALFVVIMVVSVILSKIVSYFASDDHLSGSKDDKKSKGLGSWILLVRIFILSVGLFLAIAAAGIPIDKITIIIGALGVGVGFGLQTLVNNLVSGLIIAFEKPVNVGDTVEVDGQGGIMKSIGFRSSVISTWEGADLVMPNGDLLNSHLMNWTLAGNRKRTKISLSLSSANDLQQCKAIISKLLDEHELILKSPSPFLQLDQISAGTVTLNIFFWNKNLKDSGSTKSNLIQAIVEAFKANNIPLPNQELFIHNLTPKKSNEKPQ